MYEVLRVCVLSVNLFEFDGNAALKLFAQGLNRDAVNDFIEEAANDQTTCLISGDAAGHEVEQL